MIALPPEVAQCIVDSLRPLHPERIILFGSRAHGDQARPDSDIDLMVVLAREGRPRDYREKMDNALAVRRRLRAINKTFSLDALVLTELEWADFRTQRPEFAEEIERHGVMLA